MVYPQTVTHPNINRARRRVTPLIETNALALSQATTNVNAISSCVAGHGLWWLRRTSPVSDSTRALTVWIVETTFLFLSCNWDL